VDDLLGAPRGLSGDATCINVPCLVPEPARRPRIPPQGRGFGAHGALIDFGDNDDGDVGSSRRRDNGGSTTTQPI
jgi:hypothetical protein